MDVPDYRSQRSDTPEGKGIAKRAWETYAAATEKAFGPILHPIIDPVMDPAVRKLARNWTADLLGFWTLWHLYGGFEGLKRFGYHEATIYRKVKRFRRVFGAHPDEFTIPGITVDPEAYWAAAGSEAGTAE